MYQPSTQELRAYKTFIFLAIAGFVQEADIFLVDHADDIIRVIAFMHRNYPINLKVLYRGMLLAPADVPRDRTARFDDVAFVSFSESLQVACWFADPKVNMAGAVVEKYPDASGWIGEYHPRIQEIMFHHSWVAPLRDELGENIYRVAMDIISSNHFEPHTLAQFKYHIENQQEVILAPTVEYPLRKSSSYDCDDSQTLQNQYTVRPDFVASPRELVPYGIPLGSKLYLSRVDYPLEPHQCQQCKQDSVIQVYYLRDVPLRIVRCEHCGDYYTNA